VRVVVYIYYISVHISFFTFPQLGFSDDKQVVGAHEYDKAKEKAGFVAGKHIQKKSKWWFQGYKKKDWVGNSANVDSSSIDRGKDQG
jgi:hypothetical protein